MARSTPAAANPSTRRLERQDIRTLALSAVGGALEFYDFIIYVYFVAVIGHVFFPPGVPEWLVQLQAFGIFAVGYIARPLGGIVLAHFGDRLGRKQMFMVSILLMAISTLGMGLLPTYAQIGIVAPLLLLVLRIVQGAAIGGEIPGAWVFVSEHVPSNRVGLACGMLTSGLTAGILLGSLVAAAVNTIFAPETVQAWAWRVPFLLGGVLGLLGLYLRRWLSETPVFKAMKERKALAEELPVKSVIRDHLRGVVVSVLLTWVLSACILVVILMTPTLLQTHYGIPAATALTANSIATFFLSVGCVVTGVLCDKFGAGRVLIGGSVLLAAVLYIFYGTVDEQPGSLYLVYGLAGFLVGMIAAVPYVMVHAFPPAVAFSGVSFAYNVGYAVAGGLTPFLITLALQVDPMAHAHYMLAICVLGAAIGFYLHSGRGTFLRSQGRDNVEEASGVAPVVEAR